MTIVGLLCTKLSSGVHLCPSKKGAISSLSFQMFRGLFFHGKRSFRAAYECGVFMSCMTRPCWATYGDRRSLVAVICV